MNSFVIKKMKNVHTFYHTKKHTYIHIYIYIYLSIYIYIYIYTYSALRKYWNSKDKIALLAVESRHLQIWLKDEYETKLQNVKLYY